MINGSIRKRSKDSWELTIHPGRDVGGKRKRKFVNVKGEKAAADKRLLDLLADHDKGWSSSSLPNILDSLPGI